MRLALRILSIWLALTLSSFVSVRDDTRAKVLIDADTANEVDDLFAISRALVEPSFEIVGVNATQWQISQWATPQTMEDSYRLNVRLLAYFDKTDIPHPRGAHARLYDWGDDVAQHSAAAYHIIREAQKMTGAEKLNVLALGALTNIASALLIEPSIMSKIRLYWLGTSYDFDNGWWKTLDFNSMMDLQAVNVVFSARGLEMHIMPNNVSNKMVFHREEIEQHLRGHRDVRDFLYQRWMNHMDGGLSQRVIWDLAVIEAFIHPDYTSKIKVDLPETYGGRQVFVFRDIDVPKMKEDFWQKLSKHFD